MKHMLQVVVSLFLLINSLHAQLEPWPKPLGSTAFQAEELFIGADFVSYQYNPNDSIVVEFLGSSAVQLGALYLMLPWIDKDSAIFLMYNRPYGSKDAPEELKAKMHERVNIDELVKEKIPDGYPIVFKYVVQDHDDKFEIPVEGRSLYTGQNRQGIDTYISEALNNKAGGGTYQFRYTVAGRLPEPDDEWIEFGFEDLGDFDFNDHMFRVKGVVLPGTNDPKVPDKIPLPSPVFFPQQRDHSSPFEITLEVPCVNTNCQGVQVFISEGDHEPYQWKPETGPIHVKDFGSHPFSAYAEMPKVDGIDNPTWKKSPVSTAVFRLTKDLQPLAIWPEEETFARKTEITIHSTDLDYPGVKIWYTINGKDPIDSNGGPVSSAIEYTGPIFLSSNATIKARSVLADRKSPIAEKAYRRIPAIEFVKLLDQDGNGQIEKMVVKLDTLATKVPHEVVITHPVSGVPLEIDSTRMRLSNDSQSIEVDVSSIFPGKQTYFTEAEILVQLQDSLFDNQETEIENQAGPVMVSAEFREAQIIDESRAGDTLIIVFTESIDLFTSNTPFEFQSQSGEVYRPKVRVIAKDSNDQKLTFVIENYPEGVQPSSNQELVKIVEGVKGLDERVFNPENQQVGLKVKFRNREAQVVIGPIASGGEQSIFGNGKSFGILGGNSSWEVDGDGCCALIPASDPHILENGELENIKECQSYTCVEIRIQASDNPKDRVEITSQIFSNLGGWIGTISGSIRSDQMIKVTEKTGNPTRYSKVIFLWDGTDKNGVMTASGAYIFRSTVKMIRSGDVLGEDIAGPVIFGRMRN